MVNKCLVFGCTSSEKSKNTTFHKIGKTRYQSWLRAIGRNCDENLSPNNRICSRHFEEVDIIRSGCRVIIKKDVVPTLNLRRCTGDSREPLRELHVDHPTTSNISDDSGSNINDTEMSTSDSAGLKGSPKRIRKLAKTFHTYAATPDTYKTRFHDEKRKNNRLKQQNRLEKLKNKRLKKKVRHLKDIVKILQKRELLSANACQVLENSFSGIPLAIMKRMLVNTNKTNVFRKKYDGILRSFAMTLHFYSHKAYEYVRKTFNLALPTPRTIRGWFSTINCEPGFSQPAFDTLKEKVNENNKKGFKTLCALMFDEMSIKKHIEVYNNQTWGYVNVGSMLVEDDKRDYATEAFVMIVVSLTGNWKLPIGYFFINGLDGNARANVVKEALIKLDECKVVITSLSCDGLKANFTMMTTLGVNIYNFDLNTATPYFLHPNGDNKIFIILDACHMLKLIRNNWSILTKIIDGDGEVIDFTYIKMLHYIQNTEGLRLGNKLRQAHLDWRKAQMKVNLAVQTVSASVANAIEFLMVDMKDIRFQGASATIKFIRTFDKLFDLLNSRNPLTIQWKMPLSEKTEPLWMPEMRGAVEYIKKLKTLENIPLIQSTKQTGFVGFILSTLSAIGVYEQYVKAEKYMKYLLTYKFSTDHLELFFCSIRARNGWNNNPSAVQFFHSYRRLLLHHEIKNTNGNCIPQDATNILQTTVKSTTPVPVEYNDVHIMRKYMLENSYPDNVINDHEYCLPMNLTLSEITENVVAYVAGYAVNMAKKLIKCPICQNSLVSISTSDADLKLLLRKKWGNLTVPSQSSKLVCRTVELCLKKVFLITNNQLPHEKNFIPTIIHSIHSQLVYKKNVFQDLVNHSNQCLTLEENHVSRLIKTLCSCYMKIRLYNAAKTQSYETKGNPIRKVLSKVILFNHQ